MPHSVVKLRFELPPFFLKKTRGLQQDRILWQMINREGRALSRPKIMGRHRGRPSPIHQASYNAHVCGFGQTAST